MKILVPIDGSPPSRHAVREAIKIAKKDNSSILIVNVIDVGILPVSLYNPGYNPDVYKPIYDDMRTKAQKLLDTVTEEEDFAGLEVDKLVLNGRISEEIVNIARDKNVGLIVMGKRGFTKFQRFFVGSVARRVVSEAPCPVLVVHTDEED